MFFAFDRFHAFMISVLRFAPNDESLDLSVNDRDGRIFWPAPKTFQDMHCQGVLVLSSFLIFSLSFFFILVSSPSSATWFLLCLIYVFLKDGLEVICLDYLCVDLACMDCCFAVALGFWGLCRGRWGFVWVFCGLGDLCCC